MKKLIAYYSRAGENYFGGDYRIIAKGNTQVIAEYLKDILGADMYKIEQKNNYSDNYKACIAQAKKDLKENARPELVSAVPDLSKYDEIYLGYPNYWGTMPMAVYTFLENANLKGKTIYPFCTHEGSGLSSTPNDIKKIAPDSFIGEAIAIIGSNAVNSYAEIKKWTERNLNK